MLLLSWGIVTLNGVQRRAAAAGDSAQAGQAGHANCRHWQDKNETLRKRVVEDPCLDALLSTHMVYMQTFTKDG